MENGKKILKSLGILSVRKSRENETVKHTERRNFTGDTVRLGIKCASRLLKRTTHLLCKRKLYFRGEKSIGNAGIKFLVARETDEVYRLLISYNSAVGNMKNPYADG